MKPGSRATIPSFISDLSPYSGSFSAVLLSLMFFPWFDAFLHLAAHKKSPLQKLIIANGLWFLNKQYKNFLRQTLFK